jgi:hypothetical protein
VARRVVLHQHQRAPAPARLGGDAAQQPDVLGVNGAAGERVVLRARGREGDQGHAVALDHRRRGALGAKRGQWPVVEGACPAVRRAIHVVIARDHGDRARDPAALREHFREHLELLGEAVLGEVTGEDEVIGASLAGREQRMQRAQAAPFGVLGAAQGEDLEAGAGGAGASRRRFFQQVEVGQVRDAGHGSAACPPETTFSRQGGYVSRSSAEAVTA